TLHPVGMLASAKSPLTIARESRLPEDPPHALGLVRTGSRPTSQSTPFDRLCRGTSRGPFLAPCATALAGAKGCGGRGPRGPADSLARLRDAARHGDDVLCPWRGFRALACRLDHLQCHAAL